MTDMDVKAIIKWSLKHWWWFVVSVMVCCVVGGVYYVSVNPKYNVTATLMLRQAATGKGGQDEMMQMMGFGGSKVASDEIKILSSRDLMGRVVDELHLMTTSYVKDGCKWKEQFPASDLQLTVPADWNEPLSVDVKVSGQGYAIKVKQGMFSSEKFNVANLSEPLHTQWGDLTLSMPLNIKQGHYRAVVTPRILMVDRLLKEITVQRQSRESNMINVMCLTDCPQRTIATINTLLQFYNQESATDKNILAVQTEQFLASRIAVVESELNAAEAELESYKRNQQIADLEKTAENYQKLADGYEQQIAEMDADIQVLDFIAEQLSAPEKEYAIIAGNLGGENKNLDVLIQDYNEMVVYRRELFQSATEQNTVVLQVSQLLDEKRKGIKNSVDQTRQTLNMRRQLIVNQQNQYSSRLASIPETERRYLEMSRDKETKEKQYLYLIEKREENAMLLASEAVPSKIVDQAQQDPEPAQPKLSSVGVVSLLLGLILPLLVYCFELFRKEYL